MNQSGGTNTVSSTLFLGHDSGSSGTYTLSGSGTLSVAGPENIGYSGAGAFVQSGGTHTVGQSLYLGVNSGASGSYTLSGSGSLIVSGYEILGYGSASQFDQSGGTNSVSGSLYVGDASAATYSLSSSGMLNVNGCEYVDASGLFAQSGGANLTSMLRVKDSSQYLFSGGTLSIANGLQLDGTMDCAGGPTSLSASAGGILDLAHGTLTNTGQLSITGSPNTLVVFPAGFNPGTQLAAYNNPGVTAFAGADITIPAGVNVVGAANLSEHVNAYGSLSQGGDTLNLLDGVTVYPAGAGPHPPFTSTI